MVGFVASAFEVEPTSLQQGAGETKFTSVGLRPGRSHDNSGLFVRRGRNCHRSPAPGNRRGLVSSLAAFVAIKTLIRPQTALWACAHISVA